MPQEIKRSANVELIKETDHESGFSVNIDGGCINYEYMVPHVNNGMGLLFKIQFNDGYFRDLHGAVELFRQYCEQVLKLGPDNKITLDADEVNAIHKGFANYANNNYLQMFVKNNDIVERATNLKLKRANTPEPQPVSNAEKMQDATAQVAQANTSTTPHLDVAVYGVPAGFHMDTTVRDRNKANWLDGSLQMFYENENQDGLQFVVRKLEYAAPNTEKTQKMISYNFLVFPKNKDEYHRDMNFGAANGRPGSFLGMAIILQDGYFTNMQQVYKVLSDFYYNTVIGKYITQGDTYLRHNYADFAKTDFVQTLYAYVNECIQNGKLQINNKEIAFDHANMYSKALLNNYPAQLQEQFVSVPKMKSIKLIPDNTNPLERPNDLPPIIPQNTYE